MATKLYLHNATSTVSGTLPSTVQSSLGTPAVSSDATTVNRSMDTTIGTAQTSKALTSLAQTAAQVIYFTRFCSAPLNQTSIAANTWNWVAATSEASTTGNFPAANARNVVYVWRPSSGTKVGNIFDGAGNNPGAGTTTERAVVSTFSGSALTVQVGDIICCELVFTVSQSTAVARTMTVFYDGTAETNTDGTITSNQASYINTPETISFGAGAQTYTRNIVPSFCFV